MVSARQGCWGAMSCGVLAVSPLVCSSPKRCHGAEGGCVPSWRPVATGHPGVGCLAGGGRPQGWGTLRVGVPGWGDLGMLDRWEPGGCWQRRACVLLGWLGPLRAVRGSRCPRAGRGPEPPSHDCPRHGVLPSLPCSNEALLCRGEGAAPGHHPLRPENLCPRTGESWGSASVPPPPRTLPSSARAGHGMVRGAVQGLERGWCVGCIPQHPRLPRPLLGSVVPHGHPWALAVLWPTGRVASPVARSRGLIRKV